MKNDYYHRLSEVLVVYHLGEHLCPKQNTKEYKRSVKEVVVRNSIVGTHTIQQAEVVRQLRQVISMRHGEELCSCPVAT